MDQLSSNSRTIPTLKNLQCGSFCSHPNPNRGIPVNVGCVVFGNVGDKVLFLRTNPTEQEFLFPLKPK